MLRLLAISLICTLTLAACEPTPSTGTGIKIISAFETDAIRARQVDTLNVVRGERGLTPVRLSAQLTAAALTQARDMSVQRRAWHFGSDGTSPKDRVERAGYFGRLLGENISESYDDDIATLQSWLANPITREVILDPRASEIGVGWYQEPNGKTWWVQIIAQGQSAQPGV